MASTDIDAILGALEPFSIKLDGEVIAARDLDYRSAMRLKAQLVDLTDEEAGIRAFCEALALPTDRILALPTVVVERIVEDFFAWSRTRTTRPPA
jgi:hypothetical protein